MPRLELTFSESKFAACQSGTLSRVSRAFRIPDIDSRAKCVRSIKLSLIPNPNTPRKACFKRRLKSCCRSLKAWLTSHFWWILPHFTWLVNLVPGYILDGSARKKIDLYKTPNKLNERSVQLSRKYWHGSNQRKKKKKKKSWIRCSSKRAFCWRKVPSCHENLTWKQPESIPNYTELIPKPIGPFAFIL